MPRDSTLRTPAGYRVGDLVIDVARRRVQMRGRDIRIGKLSYNLLVALAEAAPTVVTREELAARVWDGRYVTPETIKRRIALLRKAIGENAEDPTYIAVVRGHGYALIRDVEPIDEGPSAPSRWRLAAVVGVVLSVIALAAYRVADVWLFSRNTQSAVAVLPFENLSPDPADAFFAAGLHDEVVNRLAELDDLRVISRSTVQRLANSGAEIAEIADQLDVDSVMEGTVRYMDDRVRISVQLTDPFDGALLWSETFDRDFSDIFEIQREIATSVAGALGVTMRVGGSDGFRGAGTDDIEAYEAYLHGVYSLGRPEGRGRGLSFLRQAIDIDPDYSTAWAQLGYETAAASRTATPAETRPILDQAYPLALRATELDPDSARAASILGSILYARRDWIGAAQSHMRAIELRTNRYTLGQHANLLLRAGRTSAARAEFLASDSMEPLPDVVPALLVQVSIAEGKYSEARQLAKAEPRRVLRERVFLNIALSEGDPKAIRSAMHDMIAAEPATGALYRPVLDVLESKTAALRAIRASYSDRSHVWPAKGHDVALLAAYFGDADLALEAFAEEARLSTVRYWALWYPLLSEVRQLPRFKKLVSELNLVGYWRAYGWADACRPLGDADFECS
jgi:adenylate cyclase